MFMRVCVSMDIILCITLTYLAADALAVSSRGRPKKSIDDVHLLAVGVGSECGVVCVVDSVNYACK